MIGIWIVATMVTFVSSWVCYDVGYWGGRRDEYARIMERRRRS